MYKVKFHFIDKETFHAKSMILSQGCYISSAIPKKTIFITIENTNGSIYYLFLIKGRVNIRYCKVEESGKRIVLCGNASMSKFTYSLDCNKSVKIYQPSMYLMSRIIRIISKNRFEDINVLGDKIDDYCKENKIINDA